MMNEMKSAVISDIHLGCHCNSDNWHTITLDWAKWLKKELIEKDVERIIICGDFFDNRTEIGVKTIAVASEMMDIFSDFEVIMLTGNHDQFYKNRTDVHSISIFEGRKNVTVIDRMRTVELGGKKVTFIPWGEDLSNCPKSDVIFGHLEINGFKMSVGRPAEGKIDVKSIIPKAKLIFSGHFHLRDEREYKNSKIIYVGSPYQINWGEAGNMPGYYIVDFENMKYEFFENTKSPRHIKMTSEKLKLDDVSGNIILVEIDPTLEDCVIENIKNQVYQNNPLEVKFNILREERKSGDIVFSGNVDVFDIMMKFVDEMNIEQFAEGVKEKLKELYQKYDNGL